MELTHRSCNDDSVLHAFVDESERDEDYYFLCALILTDQQIRHISTNLDAVMDKHANSHPDLHFFLELHGSEIMRAAKKPWRDIPMRLRAAIYADAMKAIADVFPIIYIEGVDIKALNRRYARPFPPRELAFSHLLERINDACYPAEPRVRVTADEHHSKETSRSNFLAYQRDGTYGYKSSKLQNIVENIDFADSTSSRPLQGADMVTYIYNRLTTIEESDPRADRLKRELWRPISPFVRRARIFP